VYKKAVQIIKDHYTVATFSVKKNDKLVYWKYSILQCKVIQTMIDFFESLMDESTFISLP